MRARDVLVPGVLAVALVVAGTGWYRASASGAERRFDSCRLDGQTVVLAFRYGANEVVSPTVDTTGPDVVVALRARHGSGSAAAVAYTGEVRFALTGAGRTVRYPDGRTLDCTA